MEVVRDRADNAIIVCSIENVDPMGVHTGDSITVAPALTLTDKEYQIMRNGSIAVLREIGVETGGSNVQWAVNPEDGRMVVIEMNPRVSRSSALASKATGFPIAKIAAKLAVGYTLDELDNDITKVTPASFEPTIDYVVTKIPRFAFEKFPGAEPELTTAMKSVGEAMAIGRTIHESPAKGAGARMETGLTGFDEIDIDGAPDPAAITKALSAPDARPAARHRPGHAPRADRRRDPGRDQLRPVVPGPHPRDRRGRGAGAPRRPAGHRRRAAPAQDDGLHRCPPRRADGPRRGPGAPRAHNLGRARRLQADRHLRRRVRGADALHVFHLRGPDDGRGGMRGAALGRARRSSSSAAGRTGSARASSSTIAAATPVSR
jgi:hypothetical protein